MSDQVGTEPLQLSVAATAQI